MERAPTATEVSATAGGTDLESWGHAFGDGRALDHAPIATEVSATAGGTNLESWGHPIGDGFGD